MTCDSAARGLEQRGKGRGWVRSGHVWLRLRSAGGGGEGGREGGEEARGGITKAEGGGEGGESEREGKWREKGGEGERERKE